MNVKLSYTKLIAVARGDLEAAGSPSYLLIAVAGDIVQVISLTFSSLKPVVALYQRMLKQADPGEYIFIVARAADDRRAIFTVLDGHTRAMHRQIEVIETSIAEQDRLV